VDLLIEKAGELVQHRLREQGARLDVSLADGLPDAWVDAEQARQVLLNLLNNALDAMPSAGVVRIAAAPVERSGVAMIRIAVRDEGGGLTAESQRRLFEPFHTTKPQGTGLGLAIAASIMASQGGAITLEHTASDGTEFAVWIPQAPALPPNAVFAKEGAMP
jgi:signal transduction histidine kinase